MDWTAIIITIIICFTIMVVGEIIENIFKQKYNQKSFLDKMFNNNEEQEENK